MALDITDKPVVGQEGKVIATKASAKFMISVGNDGKQIKLGGKKK